VKFLYSDTQDYVDPGYDFIKDENAPGRRRYWDDRYAHELMTEIPYDGLLVSMSAIKSAPGVAASKGRYSMAEEQRLLRVGARKFLRFDGPRHKGLMLMGDCGAFAYADQERPAYSPEDVVEFYADAEFTHGCHPDHIIFDFHADNPSLTVAEARSRGLAKPGQTAFALEDPDDEHDEEKPRAVSRGASIRKRFDVTLENAEKFFQLTKSEGSPFEPIGVVQGWSPESMAKAARSLVKMGYGYLAVGGLVPLKTPDIARVLTAIREAIPRETRIHLLGFAKADHIGDFKKHDITSFDSTSPLIRAFKDARRNYYLPGSGGRLEYYSAIRIPQAIENARLVQAIKRGQLDANELQRHEARALQALRGFDKGQVSLSDALEEISSYQHQLTLATEDEPALRAKAEEKNRLGIEKTLQEAPWKRCGCSICKAIGVEVIIFRSANRNRRRGFHNLGVYRQHVQDTLERAP
jgi:hypothetical protein